MKLAAVAMLLIGMVLSGCVTTTDGRFTRDVDPEKAQQKYVKLATAYVGQGNLERARHHLDRALEINDDSAPALAVQGLIFNVEGEDELAERSYRRAVSVDSGYTRAHVYYGAFLYSKRRFEEARDQFRAAARDTDYDDRGGVFFNLGMTEERLGNPEAAEQAYQRAVEITRGDARALLALSTVLVEQEKYSRASRYYSRLQNLIQRSPNFSHSSESLYTGLRIARHFGDRDQAASMALMLKNQFPESVEYQQYKVLIDNDR
ncbi:type IV pilus biogenesis/stability protein PilW [Marinobacter oulmenensis]|uniref:Type IV pilus assembly protein PilF n=1 Tax=Marinobacter oulmenensis TaxID=643747 RepID=A0A840UCB9_9GAMM|nr:type IV pilus biogenesis/stability protein PilW [Marinobacter oulmenensis]MBB5320361.1 type IV pilus assembly protein PilF [Marinobacter oulmenensis]